MELNQRRTIRWYMLTIAIIVGAVFFAFLFANFLASTANTKHIQNLQEREFPLIGELIQLKHEAEYLKEMFEDAVAYENDFLLTEAQEQVSKIEHHLQDVLKLSNGTIGDVKAIQRALTHYQVRARMLADQMINNVEDLEAYEDSAKLANDAFKTLEQSIATELSAQQLRYAAYLKTINNNFKTTQTIATCIGLFLVIFLFAFTQFITKKIIKAIEKADSLKESFLTTISHELRTPLNGVKGAVELLETTELDEHQRELVTIAQFSVTGMAKVVDDVILFAELMSGKPKVMLSRFYFNEALSSLTGYAEARCKEKGLELIVDIDLPPGRIEADQRKVIRVTRQLLFNAIQYSDSGKIQVLVNYISSSSEVNGRLNITITDEGPGIDPDYLDKIYLPFEQGNSGWNRRFQGIGLGLPMAHILIDSMGGSLLVNNRKDFHGVIAEVSIPCQFPGGKEVDESYRGESVQPSMHEPANVLVVEDNKTNQLILKKILEKLHFSVEVAEHGEEAVKMAQEKEYAIIFMDCQMPVMDGFEATKIIRKLGGANAEVPIVAVTANTRDEDKARCLEVGMNGFLEKPIVFLEIKNAVKHHLNGNDPK